MFLRCLAFSRKDGSQRKYLQIVQTYRESGRVRQKIVANLGRLESAPKRETATYDPAPVIFRMVLGRLLDPSSKLSTHRWAETIWWDDGAVGELQHYYRSLGILARSIKKIEEHLYYRERDLFTPAPDLLFFDTTSTYFTGAGPMTEMG